MPFGPYPFLGHSGYNHVFVQQRRAVRGTVCEERDGAAGDEEPATKSRASLFHQSRKREQGDGAEQGRPSTLPENRGTAERRPPPNAVRASPRAKRYQGPCQPAVGRALAASEASSGRRPEARSSFVSRQKR